MRYPRTSLWTRIDWSSFQGDGDTPATKNYAGLFTAVEDHVGIIVGHWKKGVDESLLLRIVIFYPVFNCLPPNNIRLCTSVFITKSTWQNHYLFDVCRKLNKSWCDRGDVPLFVVFWREVRLSREIYGIFKVLTNTCRWSECQLLNSLSKIVSGRHSFFLVEHIQWVGETWSCRSRDFVHVVPVEEPKQDF